MMIREYLRQNGLSKTNDIADAIGLSAARTSENPLESGKKIEMHINEVYPIASPEQVMKLIGRPVGVASERKK